MLNIFQKLFFCNLNTLTKCNMLTGFLRSTLLNISVNVSILQQKLTVSFLLLKLIWNYYNLKSFLELVKLK